MMKHAHCCAPPKRPPPRKANSLDNKSEADVEVAGREPTLGGQDIDSGAHRGSGGIRGRSVRIEVFRRTVLPVFVLRPVQRGSLRFCVNVENVVSVPGIRSGVVLYRVQPPIGTSSHWVSWNTAQKPLFFAANINSVNECLQVWRISLRTYFGLKCSPVCRVFVAINSV